MKTITDYPQELSGKTVLVRVNYDVPLENGEVGDTTRIEDSVATIKYLRSLNCKIILLAHAGRPDGEYKSEYSLRPIIPIVEKLIGEHVVLADFNWDVSAINLPSAPIILMENLRFWTGEETNDTNFVQKLASFAEIYVNESFAVCHREHASITGLPHILPSYAGISLSKEIAMLDKVQKHPEHPLVVVIGGAKLDTKEPLVSAFKDVADTILVGGKVAADIKAKNLPLSPNIKLADLTADGKDITESSAQEFADIILKAKTIVWNGTMGIFEEAAHKKGTEIVAKAINDSPAFTLIGGGDTEAATTILNMQNSIDYISTGGGAMLTYLTEGNLVGIKALS